MHTLTTLLVSTFLLSQTFGKNNLEFENTIRSGDKIKIQSKGYPSPIPPNLHMTWTIRCDEGQKIQLTCSDIRMYKEANGCGDEKLIIDDGNVPNDVCGVDYDYKTVTTGNILKIQLLSGEYESGGVSCEAMVDEETKKPIMESEIYLKPGGEKEILQSPLYPDSIPRRTHVTWHINTDKDSTIRISCKEIRLRKTRTNECYPDEILKVYNGDNIKELCGGIYDYTELSSGNTLFVELITKTGGGGIHCTVQGKIMEWYGEATTEAYHEISSEEIDSSEFGGPVGPKKTTCECGWANKNSKRIVNGVEAEINEFPFMAAIRTRTGGNFCGGSILTPYHIITAAHCTWNFVLNNIPLAVSLGDHDLERDDETSSTQKINIHHIIQHPDYNPLNLQNDVALLILEKKISYNRFVGPVCLPTSGWFDLTREYVRVVGWGLLKANGPSAVSLQKVDLRVIDMESCNRVYPYVPLKEKIQICTYGHNKSPCQGDSGGPVVWVDPETNRYTLVGLVSFARVCADENPTVHAAVASYRDWIEENIQGTIPHETCSKAQGVSN